MSDNSNVAFRLNVNGHDTDQFVSHTASVADVEAVTNYFMGYPLGPDQYKARPDHGHRIVHVVAERRLDYDAHYVLALNAQAFQSQYADPHPLLDASHLPFVVQRWCVVRVGQLCNAAQSIRQVATLVNKHFRKSSGDATRVHYILRVYTDKKTGAVSAHNMCAYLVVAQHDVRAVCGLSHTFWLLPNGWATTVRGENTFNLIPAQARPPNDMLGGAGPTPQHPVTLEALPSQSVMNLLQQQRLLAPPPPPVAPWTHAPYVAPQ